jgi:hypothetical protein
MQHQLQLWSKKLSTSTNIFAATAQRDRERERQRDGFLALNLQSNFVELGFWIHQEFQGGFPPTLGLSLSRCYSESTIAHMFFSFSLSLSCLAAQWIYSKLLYLVLQAIEPTRSSNPCKKLVANDEMTTRSRLLRSSSSRIRHEPVGRLVNSHDTQTSSIENNMSGDLILQHW